MDDRYFISYRFVKEDFLTGGITEEGHGVVVSDVSPAVWYNYAKLGLGRQHFILYAEKISLALAVELVHGGAGVPAVYLKEMDDATNKDDCGLS